MARNFGAEAIPVVSTNRLQTVSPRVSADAFGALTAGATKKFGDQLTDSALFLHKGKRKQEKEEKKEADKQAARDFEKARHEQEELPDARGHAAPQPGGFNDSAATMRQFATARDEATATNELATQLPLTALDIAEQERQMAPAGARGLAERVAAQIADSRDAMISDLAERYSLRPQVVARLRRGSAGVAGAHVLEARAFEAVEGRRNFVRIETQRIGTLSEQATRRPASLPGLLATIDGIYASPATLAHLSPEEASELRGQARRAVTRAAFLSVAEQAPEKTLEALEDGALKGVAPGSSLHTEIESAAERSLRRRTREAARQEDLKDAVAFTKQVLSEQRPIDAGDPVERRHLNTAFRAAQPALLKRMMDPSTRRVGIEQTARFVETVGAMPSALGRTMTQFRGSDSVQKVAVAAGLTQRIAAGRPDLLPFGAGERETAYLFGVSQNLTDGHAPEAAVARAKRDVLEAGPETRRARVAAYAMDRAVQERENARYLGERMAAQGLGAPGPVEHARFDVMVPHFTAQTGDVRTGRTVAFAAYRRGLDVDALLAESGKSGGATAETITTALDGEGAGVIDATAPGEVPTAGGTDVIPVAFDGSGAFVPAGSETSATAGKAGTPSQSGTEAELRKKLDAEPPLSGPRPRSWKLPAAENGGTSAGSEAARRGEILAQQREEVSVSGRESTEGKVEQSSAKKHKHMIFGQGLGTKKDRHGWTIASIQALKRAIRKNPELLREIGNAEQVRIGGHEYDGKTAQLMLLALTSAPAERDEIMRVIAKSNHIHPHARAEIQKIIALDDPNEYEKAAAPDAKDRGLMKLLINGTAKDEIEYTEQARAVAAGIGISSVGTRGVLGGAKDPFMRHVRESRKRAGVKTKPSRLQQRMLQSRQEAGALTDRLIARRASPTQFRQSILRHIQQQAVKNKWSASRVLSELRDSGAALSAQERAHVETIHSWLGPIIQAAGKNRSGAEFATQLLRASATGAGILSVFSSETKKQPAGKEPEKNSGPGVPPPVVPRPKKGEDENETIKVYRIEGAAGFENHRVIIHRDGRVTIIVKSRRLFVNFGNRLEAQRYFDEKIRRAQDFNWQVKSFRVPKAFYQSVKKFRLSETNEKDKIHPERRSRPIQVHETVRVGKHNIKILGQYGLPIEWQKRLQEVIIQGTGRVETEHIPRSPSK